VSFEEQITSLQIIFDFRKAICQARASFDWTRTQLLVGQKIQNIMKKSNFRESDQLTHLNTFLFFFVNKTFEGCSLSSKDMAVPLYE